MPLIAGKNVKLLEGHIDKEIKSNNIVLSTLNHPRGSKRRFMMANAGFGNNMPSMKYWGTPATSRGTR